MVVALFVATTTVALPKEGYHHSERIEIETTGGQFNFEAATTDDGRFIGPQFWANPLQSWSVKNGKVMATGNGRQRGKGDINLQLLTHQIETPAKGFVLKADFTTASGTGGTNDDSWVGFHVGLSGGQIDDYRRPAAIPTAHLKVGLRLADGKLFMNHQRFGIKVSEKSIPTTKIVSDGSYHRLTLVYDNGTLRLSVSDPHAEEHADGGQEETFLNIDFPDASLLRGNIALALESCNVRFSMWSVQGNAVVEHSDQLFGPIGWTQYTLDEATSVLKVNAQMLPVVGTVFLEFFDAVNDAWQEVASASIDSLSHTALFRIEQWDSSDDKPYRTKYTWSNDVYYYGGVIRKSPQHDKDQLSIAAFSCDHGYAFPLPKMVHNVLLQDPDLVFFAGDQIYEHYGGFHFVDEADEGSTKLAMLDYLRKWYLFGWTWRDVLRDRPSVIIPDDHDVFMGNMWGAGGIPLSRDANEADGGYIMPPDWVNAVQRTQTDHLPDAFDPTPIEQGIGVYYTDFLYGGVPLAVIEDRKWKSGPNMVLVDDWKTASPEQLNPDGAELLGPRQEAFLIDWAERTKSVELRVVLSATIFSHSSTNVGQQLVPDKNNCDSNGWPKDGRDRALRPLMNNAKNTVMIHGDQHMGILVRQGIDDYNDGPFAFMVPGTANGYPRSWWPQGPDANMYTWTGDFVDDFGNKFTVFAVANPDVGSNQIKIWRSNIEDTAHKKGSGYGTLTYNRGAGEIQFRMWRFNFDAANPTSDDQFPGFPQTFALESQSRRRERELQREVKIESWLLDEGGNGEIISSDESELAEKLKEVVEQIQRQENKRR